MDKFDKSNDIILLFDEYSQESMDLHYSFKQAGYDCSAVVIEDDGFIPEDVISVYGFFLGDFKKARGSSAKPKYFNEVTVPDYWEISGTNNNGKINDQNQVRGKIFYARPLHKRLVKIVDWYDEKGTVRFSDHYNRFGALYARTVFNAKGQKVNKSYFSDEGREIIVENFVTKDIILNVEDKVKIFATKTDFILYFLSKAQFKQNRIFFNSLSTPFFVSEKLGAKQKRDVLFWQEPERNDVPGNMQIILNGNSSRTARILVQKRHAYDKLVSLGADKEILGLLGFIYSFEKENGHRPEALICTNSDQIEQCNEIVKALPGMHFHIAALTEMSSKLMSAELHSNVSLYPNVKQDVLDGLFQKCDYYFDINHGSEIVSAVRRAFLNNHLIFAFQETMHNKNYVADEHIFQSKDFEQMIAKVKNAMEDVKLLDQMLKKQHSTAMTETKEAYINIVEG